MKKAEVKIGETYVVKVSGVLALVKITRELHNGSWEGTNVKTNKTVRIKSAQRLRRPVESKPQAKLPSERLGVPPTTPDVDAKVEAAEDADNAPDVAAKAPEAAKDASAKTGRDARERGAKGGQPRAEGGKPMSLMDAAVDILSKGTGDPMRCQDIVDLAVKRGLWTPRTGKTPAATLYSAILREIVTKGDASRFVKTERGKFALKNSEYVREAAGKVTGHA